MRGTHDSQGQIERERQCTCLAVSRMLSGVHPSDVPDRVEIGALASGLMLDPKLDLARLELIQSIVRVNYYVIHT